MKLSKIFLIILVMNNITAVEENLNESLGPIPRTNMPIPQKVSEIKSNISNMEEIAKALDEKMNKIIENSDSHKKKHSPTEVGHISKIKKEQGLTTEVYTKLQKDLESTNVKTVEEDIIMYAPKKATEKGPIERRLDAENLLSAAICYYELAMTQSDNESNLLKAIKLLAKIDMGDISYGEKPKVLYYKFIISLESSKASLDIDAKRARKNNAKEYLNILKNSYSDSYLTNNATTLFEASSE